MTTRVVKLVDLASLRSPGGSELIFWDAGSLGLNTSFSSKVINCEDGSTSGRCDDAGDEDSRSSWRRSGEMSLLDWEL